MMDEEASAFVVPIRLSPVRPIDFGLDTRSSDLWLSCESTVVILNQFIPPGLRELFMTAVYSLGDFHEFYKDGGVLRTKTDVTVMYLFTHEAHVILKVQVPREVDSPMAKCRSVLLQVKERLSRALASFPGLVPVAFEEPGSGVLQFEGTKMEEALRDGAYRRAKSSQEETGTGATDSGGARAADGEMLLRSINTAIAILISVFYLRALGNVRVR